MPKLKTRTPVISPEPASNGSKPGHETGLLILSDGFVLPYRVVPPKMSMSIVTATTDPPEPPMKTVEAVEGPREVKNENDPDYQQAFQVWKADDTFRKTVAYLKYGALLTLSDEQNADLDEWIEDMAQLGTNDAGWITTPRSRVAAYVVYFHLTTPEDFQGVMGSLSAAPSQQEVDKVKATFPDHL